MWTGSKRQLKSSKEHGRNSSKVPSSSVKNFIKSVVINIVSCGCGAGDSIDNTADNVTVDWLRFWKERIGTGFKEEEALQFDSRDKYGKEVFEKVYADSTFGRKAKELILFYKFLLNNGLGVIKHRKVENYRFKGEPVPRCRLYWAQRPAWSPPL